MIKHGIIQGGDPLSKDPAKAKQYGTGGLGVLKAEISAERATRGAVAAVIQPGKPDSAGAQFFVCVTDQPALDGKYTIFGRVSEGIDVVTKISEAPTRSPDGKVARAHRDRLGHDPRHAAAGARAVLDRDRRRSWRSYRAVLETSRGPDHDRVLPRQGARARAQLPAARAAGVYDGMAFHRVVRGFAIQTGSSTVARPLTEKQQKHVRHAASRSSTTRST